MPLFIIILGKYAVLLTYLHFFSRLVLGKEKISLSLE